MEHTPEIKDAINALMDQIRGRRFTPTSITFVVEKMEDFYRDLLRQYLKREPIAEDGKLITIGTNPNWDYELIAIDGNPVGRIVKNYTQTGVAVTFVPDQNLKSA